MSEPLLNPPAQTPIESARGLAYVLRRHARDNDVRALASCLTSPMAYEGLCWLVGSGELQVDDLQELESCLNDKTGQMKHRPVELADARLQLFRLYRRMELHNWHHVPWILGIEGSPTRTARVLALWLTPSTLFH